MPVINKSLLLPIIILVIVLPWSLFFVPSLINIISVSLVIILAAAIWGLKGSLMIALYSALVALAASFFTEFFSLNHLFWSAILFFTLAVISGTGFWYLRYRNKNSEDIILKTDGESVLPDNFMHSLISNLPGAVYRSDYDQHWTMIFISEEIQSITGYPVSDFVNNRVRSYAEIIHADDRGRVRRRILEAIKKRELFDIQYRILDAEGEVKWVNERGRGVYKDYRIIYLDGVIVDISDQKFAKSELAAERRRLAVTLHSIGEGVIATNREGKVVLINRTAEELTGWEAEAARGRQLQDVYHTIQEEERVPCRDPLSLVLDSKSVEENREDIALVSKEGQEISIDSCAAPIKDHKERVIGLVLVFNDITDRKKAEEERDRLYQQTRRRLSESESMHMVSQALLQRISLDEVLEIVCQEAQKFTNSQGSCVFLLQDEGRLYPVYSSGSACPEFESLPLEGSLCGLAVESKEPVISNQQPSDERRYRVEPGFEPDSLLAYPLVMEDSVTGVLAVINKEGGFNQEDVRVISLLAGQATVAIENARLYREAQELAAVKERQRLSRDLHDAVSQTLFSASLISEVLPALWEKDKEEGRNRLQELRELTRGALAEMRTLLLELRPTGLTEVSLEELLNHLSEAVTGRARIPVTLNVEGEASLQPELQIALYRIAQESLNNVVKHSGAQEVKIELLLGEEVELSIIDDGCGFDPEQALSDQLGLKIMQERAGEVGGELEIVSVIGRGTRVMVKWPQRGGNKLNESGESDQGFYR